MDKTSINMKKGILFLFCITVLISCKKTNEANSDTEAQEKVITADDKEKTAKQSDGLTLLKGDFLYNGEAAVLQTHKEVYGVIIDKNMHELNKMAQPFKKEVTDMVPVVIRGKISTEKDEKILWDNKVEIKEILNVSAPNPESDDVIKLGN